MYKIIFNYKSTEQLSETRYIKNNQKTATIITRIFGMLIRFKSNITGCSTSKKRNCSSHIFIFSENIC